MILINTVVNEVTNKADTLFHNPKILLLGVALIIITIIIIKFAKKVIINSIIGVVGLLITNFVLNIKLPFIVTLIITGIFGPAGLGVMLILKFFGVV